VWDIINHLLALNDERALKIFYSTSVIMLNHRNPLHDCRGSVVVSTFSYRTATVMERIILQLLNCHTLFLNPAEIFLSERQDRNFFSAINFADFQFAKSMSA